MVTINETSYKDERLGFFADQRKLVQKRYDRLEKQIKPDEPYLSERRQFLADCGRELSFYNDVIEMLENDVVSKSEVANEIIFILAEKLHSMLPYKAFPISIDDKCEGNSYDLGRERVIYSILAYLNELKKKYEKM